jgi:L-ribulokinase
MRTRLSPVCAASVEDGLIPGILAYESRQSCVGDHFAWFVENCVPAAFQPGRFRRARTAMIDIHNLLEVKQAARLETRREAAWSPWILVNGNRSVLVDVNTHRLMLGMYSLAT